MFYFALLAGTVLTTSLVKYFAGMAGVPATMLGQILGGVLIKRFHMKVKDVIRLNIVIIVTSLLLSGVFWIRCDQSLIAGVTIGYGNK